LLLLFELSMLSLSLELSPLSRSRLRYTGHPPQISSVGSYTPLIEGPLGPVAPLMHTGTALSLLCEPHLISSYYFHKYNRINATVVPIVRDWGWWLNENELINDRFNRFMRKNLKSEKIIYLMSLSRSDYGHWGLRGPLASVPHLTHF
jgi:hypothetical protein